MKKIAMACGLLAAVVPGAAAQAATVQKTYTLEAYRAGAQVLSGTFSVNMEADTANVSVYNQQATLQSANLMLGSTAFTLANTGLFRNSSPLSYADTFLYQLYGVVGSGPSTGTGVSNALDDFSFQFNPYNGTFATNFLFNIAGTGGAKFADRIVLTEAAVPEPATWALLIVGFGFVGAAMRRRARVAVRFA